MIILSALLCFYMTGVIWVVQLIQYPSFTWIEEAKFVNFHQTHSRAMTALAGPTMIGELALAVGLVMVRPGSIFCYVNLGGVVALWLCTFFISVPIHNRLAHKKEVHLIARLVRTNWIRTGLWTVRSLLFLFLILEARV